MTPLPNNSAEGICHSSHMEEDHIPHGCPSSSHDATLNLFDESDRLKTFANWSNPFANRRSLAAAGFFHISYANTGDFVKCPFCQLEISRWEEGADPFDVHRRKSPNCAYMKNIKSKSTTDCVPSCMSNLNAFENRRTSMSDSDRNARKCVTEQFKINTSETPAFPHYVSKEDRLRSYESWPRNFKIRPETLVEAGFFYIGPGTRTTCFQCGGSIIWDDTDDPFVEHEHWFPKCFHVMRYKICKKTNELAAKIAAAQCIPRRPEHTLSPSRTANLNFALESDRLKTFNDWPVSFIDRNELAAAGFYYSGRADLVICNYCNVSVCNWEEGDDPAAEHVKHSPNCEMVPFCKMILEKKSDTMEPLQSALVNGYDTCGLYDTPNQKPPKYVRYSTIESRIESFRNWPQQYRIPPNTLWEAGFFYSGIDDHCICFQCGTGLKQWKEDDDPWTEHALWYPQCDHLVSTKGSAFVHDACRNRRDTVSLSEEEIKEAMEVLQNLFLSVINLPDSNIGNVNENVGCDNARNVVGANRVMTDEESSDDNENSEKMKLMCKICFVNNWSKLLYPCGHVACAKCAKNLDKCAFCRQRILDRVQMYVQ